MPTRRPTLLVPCATFEHDGLYCEAFALATPTGRWAGHVTVHPAGRRRKVMHRLVVNGEHESVAAFVSAAAIATREQLAARAIDKT